MDIVSIIDIIYHTRDVSACLVILDDQRVIDNVALICEAKLYPVNTARFVLHTWQSFIKDDIDIQEYDLVILSKHIPIDRIISMVRMNSVLFIL